MRPQADLGRDSQAKRAQGFTQYFLGDLYMDLR